MHGNESDHANELMRFRYILTYVDEGVDVLTLSSLHVILIALAVRGYVLISKWIISGD